jgi:hypothetical protein
MKTKNMSIKFMTASMGSSASLMFELAPERPSPLDRSMMVPLRKKILSWGSKGPKAMAFFILG